MQTLGVRDAQPRLVAAPRAVSALGASAARVAVLSYLAHHPGCRRTEVCEELALPPATVGRYLRDLIDEGLVTTTPAAGTIARRTVRYSTSVAAVVDVLDELRAAVAPEPEEPAHGAGRRPTRPSTT